MNDERRALQAVSRVLAKHAKSREQRRRGRAAVGNGSATPEPPAEPPAPDAGIDGTQAPAAGEQAPAASEQASGGPPAPVAPIAQELAVSEPVGTGELLAAYRALASLSARLSDRLSPDDPLVVEARETLEQAQRAWDAVLRGNAERSPQSPSATVLPEAPAAGPFDQEQQAPESPSVASVELVPASARELTTAARPLPDEAALVRYLRRRRERRRLPDESTIGRYLRERRERGPRWPDEAGIKRYLRERRERY